MTVTVGGDPTVYWCPDIPRFVIVDTPRFNQSFTNSHRAIYKQFSGYHCQLFILQPV